MKKMSKILSVLLAVALLLSFAVTASAADEFTITAPDNGHTYEAYQIFRGDYHDGKLSNIVWGASGTGTEGQAVPESVINAITAVAESDDRAILDVVEANADLGKGTPTALVGGTAVAVAPGYYLIKDSAPVTGEDTATLYILRVVGAATFQPKVTGTPTVEKKVGEGADKDAASYSVGDTIPYTLTATLPATVSQYQNAYVLKFIDTMSVGLVNPTITSVTVTGVEGDLPDTAYTMETEAATEEGYTGGTKMTVTIPDARVYGEGAVITVKYTATLSEAAVVGKPGNPNKVYLEFSNNPNTDGGSETGTTPPDINVVFTFKGIVDKIDPEGGALSGAGFTLYKKNGEDYVAVGDEKAGVTTFEFSGLGEGTYRLVETTTPAGYNTAAPIDFVIAATYTEGDEPALATLTVNNTDFTAAVDDGNAVKVNGAQKALNSGEIFTEVVNKPGSLLPSTGGIGTTIFYVAGAILVLGAGVMLFVKKRASVK